MNARFQPDEDDAQEWATGQLCGGDPDLTTQTFAEFCNTSSNAREPLLTQSVALLGPISSAKLVCLLLNATVSDEMLGAVARELRARYLADDFTKQNIEGQIGVYLGVA
jgi:hypothetical protein